MSLLENCALSITGAVHIWNFEKDFDPFRFNGVVIGVHILGLFLKLMYYQFQHPWMELSDARDCMGKVVKAILFLIATSIVVGIPTGAYMISPSTTSKILSLLCKSNLNKVHGNRVKIGDFLIFGTF